MHFGAAWTFFGQFKLLLWSGTTSRCRNLLLSPENFAQGRLMKVECLIADETSFRSPDRVERDILGIIVCVFEQFRPLLWFGTHVMMYESPLEP